MYGIVIRQTRLGDTSLIFTWLSRDEGKIKTVAKGICTQKSPMAGQVDLFCVSDFEYARSRRSDLHALREARLIEAHEGLRRNYPALQAASYFSTLIDRILEPEHPEPDLYDLLARALGHISQEGATLKAVQRFELRLAQTLGLHHGNADPITALASVLPRLPELRETVFKVLSR